MRMRKILMIVRREYLEIVRTKTFWIGMLAFPLFVVGLFGIQIAMAVIAPQEQKRIVMLDATGALADPVSEALARHTLDGGSPEFVLEILPVEGGLDDARSRQERRVLDGELYGIVTIGSHTARIMLAKNPAGWQEALSMIDKHGAGVVISVNGRVPDGEDLSWLWDVRFEHFDDTKVVAAGERGTDLAVRLEYAGVEHTLVHDTVSAIASCPPGHVEVIANYTAFLQLQRALARHRG